jgi:hypothetical protein
LGITTGTAGLWIQIRIGPEFNDFVDSESGSMGKKNGKNALFLNFFNNYYSLKVGSSTNYKYF